MSDRRYRERILHVDAGGHPPLWRGWCLSRDQNPAASAEPSTRRTYIAVQLLRRIAAARQLRRALFVLRPGRAQEPGARSFPERVRNRRGDRVGRQPPEERAHPDRHLSNSRRGHRRGGGDVPGHASPENYFSHIVIDECHCSAWGKWSQVLPPTWTPHGLRGAHLGPRHADRSRPSRATRARPGWRTTHAWVRS